MWKVLRFNGVVLCYPHFKLKFNGALNTERSKWPINVELDTKLWCLVSIVELTPLVLEHIMLLAGPVMSETGFWQSRWL